MKVFIDSNVPMYVAGRDHPNREPSRRFLDGVRRGVVQGCTSTEVLQISEIAPGMYIELFNAGDRAINLGTSGFQFCSPFNYAGVGTGTLAPGAYITVPWPSGFIDSASRGEMILYRNSAFDTPASIMDFVCWGTGGRGTRQDTAETASRWSGACAPAITGGAIHRLTASNGTIARSEV